MFLIEKMMNCGSNVQNILKKTAKVVPRYGDTYSKSWLVYEILKHFKEYFNDVEPRSDCILGFNEFKVLSPDVQSVSNNNLLHLLCDHNISYSKKLNIEIYVKGLLELGADPSLCKYHGKNLLNNIWNSNLELKLLKLLLSYRKTKEIKLYENDFDEVPDWNPFHCVIECDDQEMFEYLLSNGADINHHSWDSCNALNYAVLQRNFKYIKLIIEAGADLNIEFSPDGNDAMTAVDLLFYEDDYLVKRVDTKCKIECLNYLLEAGATYN